MVAAHHPRATMHLDHGVTHHRGHRGSGQSHSDPHHAMTTLAQALSSPCPLARMATRGRFQDSTVQAGAFAAEVVAAVAAVAPHENLSSSCRRREDLRDQAGAWAVEVRQDASAQAHGRSRKGIDAAAAAVQAASPGYAAALAPVAAAHAAADIPARAAAAVEALAEGRLEGQEVAFWAAAALLAAPCRWAVVAAYQQAAAPVPAEPGPAADSGQPQQPLQQRQPQPLPLPARSGLPTTFAGLECDATPRREAKAPVVAALMEAHHAWTPLLEVALAVEVGALLQDRHSLCHRAAYNHLHPRNP